MNTQALLVAIAIIAAFSVAAITTPALAQNMTGGENMTATMDDNMTALGGNMSQPLEDQNTKDLIAILPCDLVGKSYQVFCLYGFSNKSLYFF
jgi:hypothetical protein